MICLLTIVFASPHQ